MTAYVTREEFYLLGIPSGSLTNVSGAAVDAHISGSSALIDGYLRSQHTLPLTEVPEVIKVWTSQLAAYGVAKAQGMKDESALMIYAKGYYDLAGEGDREGLLSRVSRGEIMLSPTIDSTPNTNDGRPRVTSGRVTVSDNPSRMGWRSHGSS